MKKVACFTFVFTVLTSSLFGWTIDHKVEKSHNVLITSHYDVPYIMGYTLIGTALIEGNGNSRFGKTTFQALDSFILANLSTEVLKRTFQRVRPRDAETPNEWFESSNKAGDNSFPSGHVASVTSAVTPYILEYKEDYPLIHLLWLLPVQQMVGRVNAQAHWQSDVLTAFILGVGTGYYAHSREKPLILSLTEDGIFVGLRYRF